MLLAFASDGARSRRRAAAAGGGAALRAYIGEANAALRAVYGAAALPEHLPPSEAATH